MFNAGDLQRQGWGFWGSAKPPHVAQHGICCFDPPKLAFASAAWESASKLTVEEMARDTYQPVTALSAQLTIASIQPGSGSQGLKSPSPTLQAMLKKLSSEDAAKKERHAAGQAKNAAQLQTKRTSKPILVQQAAPYQAQPSAVPSILTGIHPTVENLHEWRTCMHSLVCMKSGPIFLQGMRLKKHQGSQRLQCCSQGRK